MSKGRRLLLAVAALCAVLWLAACGSSDDQGDTQAASTTSAATTTPTATAGTATTPAGTAEATKCVDGDPVNFIFTGFAANNTWTVAQVDALKQVMKDCPNVKMTFFDAGYDSSKQVALVQDAIASGKYNGLLLESLDGSAMVPVVERAIDQKMKVVGIFTAIGPDFNTIEPQVDGLTTFIGTTITSQGQNIGQLAVEACGDKDPCNVAYLLGAASTPLETVRYNAFRDVLKQHPSIKIVANQSGDLSTSKSQAVVQNILRAHPDLNVVATSGDQMTKGAELAVDQAGASGKVALIGSGASRIGVEAVRSGKWFGTALLLPAVEARVGAITLINAIRGEQEPQSIDTTKLSPLGGSMLGTKSVLDKYPDFQGDWEGSAG